MSEQKPASPLGFIKDVWRRLYKHPVITKFKDVWRVLLEQVITKFKAAWGVLRKHPVITIFTAFLIAAVIVVVVIVILGYVHKWDWTGFTASTGPSPTISIYQPGKTLWDWLQLLIIPVVLAVGGYIFSRALQRREQKTTAANQEEAALQSYLKNMAELLLQKPLPEDSPEKKTREKIMRAYTLTTLQLLKSERKRSLFLFLQDTNLISKKNRIVQLKDADLTEIPLPAIDLPEVDLAKTLLQGANLGGAVLREADLSGAILANANLSRANLSGANLSGADLFSADLTKADLTGAILNGANLRRTDLSNAYLWGAHLSEAMWLDETILKGARHNTKEITITDTAGTTLKIPPAEWPQKFDLKAAKVICDDC